MSISNRQLAFAAVAAVAVVTTLPFLGLTDFTTKGEPREAVVALSMLNEGNWILPVNNGGDIPYKPPFFHFCIALVSMLTGHVGEYTSRLPSALALIAMTCGGFAFFAKRRTTGTAALAALLTLTAFEVHRAATVCRVDMMLTAFTVGAMLLLYRWRERGSRGVPFWAVLCMSGAVLTKGPVGFIVPCLVMGLFSLLRGDAFWRTLLRYAAFALLSCILPAVWYVAAWREGGDAFLQLVYEENIGRMTGTMSYESHAHPFTYNFVTLLSGWAPWVLLMLFSLFEKPWKRLRNNAEGNAGGADNKDKEENKEESKEENKEGKACAMARFCKKSLATLRHMDGIRLFVWLAAVIPFVFYCLPSSKRSVYLLPCYPFMAVLMAEYIGWLWRAGRLGALKAYIRLISALAVLTTVAAIAIRTGLVPVAAIQKSAPALATAPLGFWGWLLVAVPTLAALRSLWLISRKRLHADALLMASALCAPVIALFFAFDGFWQPAVMNTRSLRPMALTIEKKFPGEPLYSYIKAPMMHFFGADFYLGDRIGQFENTSNAALEAPAGAAPAAPAPQKGILIVPEGDFAELALRHPDYEFELVFTSEGRISEVKSPISFYRFCKK